MTIGCRHFLHTGNGDALTRFSASSRRRVASQAFRLATSDSYCTAPTACIPSLCCDARHPLCVIGQFNVRIRNQTVTHYILYVQKINSPQKIFAWMPYGQR